MELPNHLVCIPAADEDIDDMINLQFAACENYDFHDAVWGLNTPENRRKAGNRLVQKWKACPGLHVVKCLDSTTGDMLAFCLWEMVPATASQEDAVKEDAMSTCEWLHGKEREVARAHLIPALHKRWEVMQGRPYAVLTNLCTAPQARKRGAGMALVNWGIERADAMAIPAYCEASEMGLKLYLQLGFAKVDTVETVIDGEVVDESPVLLRPVQRAEQSRESTELTSK